MAIRWRKKSADTFNSFDRIHEGDGQTDGRTPYDGMATLTQNIARQQNGSDYNEYICSNPPSWTFFICHSSTCAHTKFSSPPLLYENWDVYRVLKTHRLETIPLWNLCLRQPAAVSDVSVLYLFRDIAICLWNMRFCYRYVTLHCLSSVVAEV